MRTVTTHTVYYKFHELDKLAQERAVAKLANLNVDDWDWWHWVYESANAIGVSITSFELDRHLHAKGQFTQSPLAVINAIKAAHVPDNPMHRVACQVEIAFLTANCETTREDITEKFLKTLLGLYATALQEEWDYLTSKEAVIDTIRANDYEFNKYGHLMGSTPT